MKLYRSDSLKETNSWRIYHDISKGIWIDNYNGNWLLQSKGDSLPKKVISLFKENANSVYWKIRNKSATNIPKHIFGKEIVSPFIIKENNAEFIIDFSSGYSPGIFLDQRLNRLKVKKIISPKDKILNAFAYTGAFSVVSALEGAVSTTIDISSNYLYWVLRNFKQNNLDVNNHYRVKGDVFDIFKLFIKKGRKFNGIIIDPPTFSRFKGGSFKIEKDYSYLLNLAVKLIHKRSWILCCANTYSLSEQKFKKTLLDVVKESNIEIVDIKLLPMPPEFNGDNYLKSFWILFK